MFARRFGYMENMKPIMIKAITAPINRAIQARVWLNQT